MIAFNFRGRNRPLNRLENVQHKTLFVIHPWPEAVCSLTPRWAPVPHPVFSRVTSLCLCRVASFQPSATKPNTCGITTRESPGEGFIGATWNGAHVRRGKPSARASATPVSAAVATRPVAGWLAGWLATPFCFVLFHFLFVCLCGSSGPPPVRNETR